MTPDDTPTPRDHIITAALIAGHTWDEAAQQAKCSRATVSRVAREHRDSIETERAERARQIAERLKGAALLAVDAVIDVLVNESNNTVRMQAARIALGDALRWIDQAETNERLAALEARAGLRVV